MSEPTWRAVLVTGPTIRVWPMQGDAPTGPAQDLPRYDLATLPSPVIAAGLDVAPRPVPGKPLTGTTHADALPHIAAIPMLWQDTPAACSQGTETAIAGYLQTHANFDGVILVIGQHSCWAHISASEVVSFQTFLTRQIAEALGAPHPAPGPAFDAGLAETLSRPDRIAQHLSSAQAGDTGQAWAHLIGAELASAKPYWLGQQVVILADGAEGAAYVHALCQQGADVQTAELTPAYLSGFSAAWMTLAP